MECPKCNSPMMIDEWNGWVWTCFHCDHIGRPAIDDEVKKLEESKTTPNSPQNKKFDKLKKHAIPLIHGMHRPHLKSTLPRTKR